MEKHLKDEENAKALGLKDDKSERLSTIEDKSVSDESDDSQKIKRGPPLMRKKALANIESFASTVKGLKK